MPSANGYKHAVVAPGPRGEQTVTAAKRLTKAAAHKLIGAPGRHLTPSVLSAVLVVIESGRVRAAQRAQGATRRLGGGEAVAAQDVEYEALSVATISGFTPPSRFSRASRMNRESRGVPGTTIRPIPMTWSLIAFSQVMPSSSRSTWGSALR